MEQQNSCADCLNLGRAVYCMQCVRMNKGHKDMFLASSGSGAPFFYCIFGGADNENSIYELKNGTLEKTVFKADDDRYYITAASRSLDGKTLLQVDYTNPEDRNDSLPAKIYYF